MGYLQYNFDIDRYLNPLVPSPPWQHIPYPVARFFGYRKTKATPTGNLVFAFWAFIGIFCAITIIQVVSKNIPAFQDRAVPLIVGSFGATAVLEFYAIDSPLAQPRNAFIGHLMSAIIGVAVARLFLLSDRFDEIQYLGGALACAAATSLMGLTKTVHPPAGATALLAVVDNRLVSLGWFLIPVMMLGGVLMLSVSLIINNIQRRYPVYWWTPEDLKKASPMFRTSKTATDKAETGTANGGASEVTTVPAPEAQATNGSADTNQSTEKEEVEKLIEHEKHGLNETIIRPGLVIVPESMYLTQEEKLFLETLSRRL